MMRQLADKVIKKDRKLHAVFVDLTTRYVGRSCGKPWRYGVSGDVIGFRAITNQVKNV